MENQKIQEEWTIFQVMDVSNQHTRKLTTQNIISIITIIHTIITHIHIVIKRVSSHTILQITEDRSHGNRENPGNLVTRKRNSSWLTLRKFGQDFKLSDPSIDKKATGQQQPQPTQQFTAPNSIPLTKPPQNAHILPPQATTPSQPTSNLHLHQAPTSLPTQRQSPASEPQTASSNNSNITITGVPQQPQQPPPASSQQQQQQESTPQSQPSQSNSQVNPETSSHHDSKGSEDENSVVNSNLNPNAKEFVFNPNAKPFNPRSPSTTTPPRVQTPQIAPQPPPPLSQSQIGSVPPSVGFQQNMLHYVMAQPFPVQSQPRFPKRGPGSNQRTDYASSMQVAAATGHPILAPTPLTSITTPQTIPATAVPIPQNIMPQTHQPYQYQGMSMMLRLPPPGIPMVTTMVPTSMGVYYHGAEGHQNSQGHTPPHMYVTPGVPPHQGHQPHPAPTPGPHPGQPPTPQGHSSGGGPAPPNMPAQPPTPGPTPPQAMMYSGPGSGPMGAQPTIPQHLSQHSPHTGQSPHNPYQNPNAALAAAAAAAASQHHPTATQLVMIPPHLAPHMMPPGGAPPPPPHSGSGHAPSSAAGYTATSSASMQQHVNHGHHVHYIPGVLQTLSYVESPSPLLNGRQDCLSTGFVLVGR
ncbi:hypothetical protein Anas_05128 [Armadillidium nasatum]|uniref:Uncharacterized protein n=1 Tax=Armadillidium nasatum TaxID=96803 RepID=A0A5N5SS69_9CRUS|nr:hypothetical protein Anas_05128 [Armadillidium nasatum]